MRLAAACVAACCAGSVSAQEPLRYVRDEQISVFGGIHVSNTWQDVFRDPDQLDWDEAWLVGVGYGRDWRSPGSAFSYGFELQANVQLGRQEHVELNLPFLVRYNLAPKVPVLRSFAFGIGPSYATKVPQYEVETRGDSQQFLVYWTMEAEFGAEASALSFFARLHHRSGAFGAVADEGASNAIVWGLRRRW